MINGRLLHDAAGATAVEYGLIAALIAVAADGAMAAVGEEVHRVATILRNAVCSN